MTVNFPLYSLGVTPMGPPPPNSDWWVEDYTVINDTSLEVNGNLTINNTGTLELINVTLVMNGNISVFGDFILRNVTLTMNCSIPGNNSPANGLFGIVVETKGLMHILDYDNDPITNDSSTITSGIKDGAHCYTFWVK